MTILEDIKNRKRKLKSASKILNLFIDAGKCLKYSKARDTYATEVDKCAEEVLVVVAKLAEDSTLGGTIKQLKERMKHLKGLIKL